MPYNSVQEKVETVSKDIQTHSFNCFLSEQSYQIINESSEIRLSRRKECKDTLLSAIL